MQKSIKDSFGFFRLVLLVEGVASIGIQFLTMRLTTPYVGSSVVPTSIIITTILLFLAIGYRSGGRYQGDGRSRIVKNLLGASALVGIGLSEITVSLILEGSFTPAGSTFVLLPAYLLAFIAPSVYLLAQVIPLVIGLDKTSSSADKKAGDSYFYSTIGNVAGGLFLTLVILYFFGPAVATILISCSLLCLAVLIDKQPKLLAYASAILVLTLVINHFGFYPRLMDYSRYGNRIIVGDEWGTRLIINGSSSSGIRNDGRTFEYVEFIRKNHLRPSMDVAVLGAGGFVLGKDATSTNFTYVDIDSKLQDFSEKHLLHEPINGKFVVQDARVFVNNTKERFDLVVVDVFGSGISIPEHLKTVEFYSEVPRILKPNGRVVINVIHKTEPERFDHAIARSIHAGLGFCLVAQTSKGYEGRANFLYDCQPTVSARAFSDKRVSLFNSPKGF